MIGAIKNRTNLPTNSKDTLNVLCTVHNNLRKLKDNLSTKDKMLGPNSAHYLDVSGGGEIQEGGVASAPFLQMNDIHN